MVKKKTFEHFFTQNHLILLLRIVSKFVKIEVLTLLNLDFIDCISKSTINLQNSSPLWTPDIPQIYPRYTPDISQIYPRYIQIYHTYTSDIPQIYPRYSPDISQIYRPDILRYTTHIPQTYPRYTPSPNKHKCFVEN